MSTVLVAGSVNLNDGVNTILLGLSLGTAQREAEQLGGPGVDIAASGPLDESAWVETTAEVLVAGSSVDDVMARVSAIAAELRDCSDWTVGLDGSAYTGTLRVKLGRCVELPLEAPWMTALVGAHKTRLAITVLREPWVYGASTVLYSASSVALPCVLDLSAMSGDAPGPLELLLDADADVDLHQVVAGVYPDETAAISDFVLRAVTLSWSGGSAMANATGYPDGVGNTVWYTDSPTGVSADIDTSGYVPGIYALYANIAGYGSDPVGVIETTYTDPVEVVGSQLRRHLLGLVSLPCQHVRGAASSALRVRISYPGSAGGVVLNTVELVPCHAGLIGWHPDSPSVYADTLRFADGVVYADDVASLAYLTHGARLRTLGGALVLTGEGTVAAPTVAATVTITYRPRWEQLPTTGSSSGPGI